MTPMISIGQYQGYYRYGPEYGEIVEGKEVEFRMFIDQVFNYQFSGKVIDWDGFGAEGEVAFVSGFVQDDMISFVKQYDRSFIIDEFGVSSIVENQPGHKVEYEGHYDVATRSFIGTWEIKVDSEDLGDFIVEELVTGTWRMSIS